jgi:hypothetical protein
MELADLVEGAIVNYLKEQENWPATMQRGAGEDFQLRIFPGESGDVKDGQCIVCKAERDFPEHIPSSAIYEVPCEVILRTPSRRLAEGEQAPDPVQSHQQPADALRAALMANGLEVSLTAVQQGFTVFGVLNREPMRGQETDYWESGLKFSLVCCAAAFPN